jgi:hypothetical protein
MPQIGVGQYFGYGTSTADTAIGIVTGGDLGWNPNIQTRQGIYAQAADVGGSMSAAGTASIALQAKALFTTAGNLVRASATSPTINALVFEGGASDDGSAWKHTGCKLTSATFACAVDGPLTADIAWVGTGEDVGAAAPPVSTQLTYEWFSGVVTIDSAALLCQDMSLAVTTGVAPYWSLDTKADHKRMPDGLTVGSQNVTLTCNVLTFPGTTRVNNWVLGDAPTGTIAASFAFTGTDTITFTLANLTCTSMGIPFQAGDGAVVYPLGFKAKPNDITALTIA